VLLLVVAVVLPLTGIVVLLCFRDDIIWHDRFDNRTTDSIISVIKVVFFIILCLSQTTPSFYIAGLISGLFIQNGPYYTNFQVNSQEIEVATIISRIIRA